MKVYVVMDSDYNGDWIEAVFANRELAEQYLIEQQRTEWQKLVDRVGQPIPNTGWTQWTVKVLPNGSQATSAPQHAGFDRYEHPGPFKPRPISEYDISEHEVIAAS